MKRYILLLTLLTATTLAATNLTGTGADVDVSILKYEPVPAQPGDEVTVWISVENNGGGEARGVTMEYLDNYPFTLQTGEQRTHTIRTLPGGEEYVAKFRTRIAQDASSGTAQIAVKYDTKAQGYQRLFLPLDIKSRITTLRITDVTTTPERFTPGGTGNLSFTVENIADSLVQDVTLTLDLAGSDAPVTPKRSSTELKIDELRSGAAHTFTYSLSTEYDAEANVYRIPVNLSFTTESGETVTNDDTVGIAIAADPALITTVDSHDIYTDKKRGTVTLKFVNRGTDEIKFTSATLRADPSYALLSPSREYYIGNIRSDDYELQDLRLRAQNDTVTLPLTITYHDAANKEYTREETITLDLVEQAAVEGEQGSNTWIYIAILIAVLLAAWWWKRR